MGKLTWEDGSWKLIIPHKNQAARDFATTVLENKYMVFKSHNADYSTHIVFPHTYVSAWDIVTSDWYEDVEIDELADLHIKALGDGRRSNELKERVIDNNETFFGYQWQTARRFETSNSIFINDGTGLGKTRSALACLENNFRLGPNIIVCPKAAIDVWKKEIENVFPYADYISIVGDAKERKLRLQHIEDVNFVIISYDALIKHSSCTYWPNSKKLETAELDTFKWNAVIVDESHRIKNPKALRTRCCWQLSKNADKRIALTATPITLSPEDLWAQWRFLAPDEFPSLTRWRERFLHMEEGYHGGLECVGWKEYGYVHYLQLCGWRTTKRKFEDVQVTHAMKHMTVPEEGPHTVIEVPLTSSEATSYRQMWKTYVAFYEDEPLIAQNDLDRFTKLRQLANGTPVLAPDGRVLGLDSPSGKLNHLINIVDDATCNIVVFAEHSKVAAHMYWGLRQKLEFDAELMLITGETRHETRTGFINKFQDTTNDCKQVLICTTGTMAESVSLTNAGLLIFAQEPASMQEFVQCRGRVRRIGSNIVVPVISLRAKDTVETHLALRMDRKLSFLKEYMKGKEDVRN